MGTSFCVGELSSTTDSEIKLSTLSRKGYTPTPTQHYELALDAAVDQIELDDAPPPSKFIEALQSRKLFSATNNLQFLTAQLREPKTPSCPNQMATTQRVKGAKRCSIDVIPSFLQAKATLTGRSLTVQQMSSSFNRIEISPEIFIKIQTDDISTFYKFEENVGEGAYGSVYRAVSLRDKEIRAIKVIRKEVMKSSSKGLLLAELELLRKMDHPNIIKLFEIFESERAYYVVTEFCEGGSIIDLIRQRRCVKEEYIRIIILQLLSCLNYMHKLKIVHRDIKLENVVLLKSIREYSKPEDIEIRLLDFGTAFKMHNFVQLRTELIGTVSYMSPQMIKGHFNEKCDLWSCGVIICILFTGRRPFRCKTREETFKKILVHEIDFTSLIWRNVNPRVIDLLKSMLNKDPPKRISAEKALQHPWFVEKLNEPNFSSQMLEKMSDYDVRNNLISMLESYLVFRKVPQADRVRIAAQFKQLDKNLDGLISIGELIQAYNKMEGGLNVQDIEIILTKLDKDKSGQINLSEFMTAIITPDQLFVKAFVQDAFDYFDADHTGYIEKAELIVLLKGCEREEIDELIDEIDLDEDQRVSKNEFLQYMERQNCCFG